MLAMQVLSTAAEAAMRRHIVRLKENIRDHSHGYSTWASQAAVA